MNPTIVYKCPGKNRGPSGIGYDYRGVKTEGELQAFLDSGWFHSLTDAVEAVSKPKLEKKADVVVDDSEPTKDNSLLDSFNENPRSSDKAELKELGASLGVKLTMNHSELTMSTKIKEALN